MRVRVSRREFLADSAVALAAASPLAREAAWTSQPLTLPHHIRHKRSEDRHPGQQERNQS